MNLFVVQRCARKRRAPRAALRPAFRAAAAPEEKLYFLSSELPKNPQNPNSVN